MPEKKLGGSLACIICIVLTWINWCGILQIVPPRILRNKRSSHLGLVCGSQQLPRRNLTNIWSSFYGHKILQPFYGSQFTGLQLIVTWLLVTSRGNQQLCKRLLKGQNSARAYLLQNCSLFFYILVYASEICKTFFNICC